MTLIGFCAVPFVWSYQESRVTAELSCAFPHSSGGVIWCEAAFGPYAGWLNGMLSLVSGVSTVWTKSRHGGWLSLKPLWLTRCATNLSLFQIFSIECSWQTTLSTQYFSWTSKYCDNLQKPVLFFVFVFTLILTCSFTNSLLQVLPAESQEQESLHPILRLCLLSILAIGLGYMNWRGLNVVGNVSIVICVIAMSPFLILTLFSIAKVDTSRWFVGPQITPQQFAETSDYSLDSGFFPRATIGGVLLRPFLNSLFWNFNSFDSTAAFSEEVGPNPERVIPRALTIGFLFVIIGYFVPVLVALGVSTAPQEEWVDGYMATVASKAVGPWLGDWTVLAAGISNIALYQAELSGDVFLIMGMAHRGLLPSFLGVRSSHGTPTNAIIN